MNFDVKAFCEEKNIDERDFMQGLDLHLKLNLGPIISQHVGACFSNFRDDLVSEIIEKMPEAKKGPGRPKGESSKSTKNQFYAPNRETILCFIEHAVSAGNGNFHVTFCSCVEKTYGLFRHEKLMNHNSFIELFYDCPVIPGQGLSRDYENPIPRFSVQSRISEFSDILDNIANSNKYVYNIDVKRTSADIREAYEVMSIDPYSKVQGNQNGHSDL